MESTVEGVARRIAGTGFKYSGNSDSGCAFFLPELSAALPGLRIVYVHRKAEDCIKSFNKVSGIKRAVLAKVFDGMLKRIAAFKTRGGVMDVNFSDLGSAHTARDIWAHVAPGETLHEAHWHKMARMRVEQHSELIRNAASVGAGNVITGFLNANPDQYVLAK